MDDVQTVLCSCQTHGTAAQPALGKANFTPEGFPIAGDNNRIEPNKVENLVISGLAPAFIDMSVTAALVRLRPGRWHH